MEYYNQNGEELSSQTQSVDELLSMVPGYSSVPEGIKIHAVSSSLIPDAEGNFPGDSDYVSTHDQFYAALQLVAILSSMPAVTTTSSEGTSVTATKMDWENMRRWLKSQSLIYSMNDSVFGIVDVTGYHDITRTNMSGKRYRYGDIDTDIN